MSKTSTEDSNYLGSFDTIGEVYAIYPSGGVPGDFVIVSGVILYWDESRLIWSASAKPGDDEKVGKDDLSSDVQESLDRADKSVQSVTVNNVKYTPDATGDVNLGTISGGGGGAAGVGIQSIVQTSTSTESGGENVITVTLTDGTIERFSIRNGARGQQGDKGDAGYSISESIGSGLFSRALEQANLTPDTMFQWILIDTDDDNNPVKKVIWHIGQGNFIDANGSPMTQEE